MKRLLTTLALILCLVPRAHAQMVIKKSEATGAETRIPLYLVDDTDGKTPETGITFSGAEIKVSKNGAAEASFAGTVTEVAGGVYYYTPTSGEIDTTGFLSVRTVKTGVRAFVGLVQVTDFDLTLANDYPVNGVACSGSPTAGSVCSRLKQLTDARGTVQSFPASTSVQLAAAEDFGGTGIAGNVTVFIVSATTGAYQPRCITAYNNTTDTATVAAWAPTPTGTVTYDLIATPNCNAAGGGGTVDWTDPEKEQIRQALGITGIKTATSAGNLDAVKTKTDGLNFTGTDVKATLDGETVQLASGTHTGAVIPTCSVVTGTVTVDAASKIGVSLASSQTFNNTGTWTGAVSSVTGNVGGNVGGSCASVTAAVTCGSVSTSGISDTTMSSAAVNRIADTVLRRTNANIEASPYGDTLGFQSLYGQIAKNTNNLTVVGNALNIYKADGATLFKAQSLSTTSGAAPITGLGTN